MKTRLRIEFLLGTSCAGLLLAVIPATPAGNVFEGGKWPTVGLLVLLVAIGFGAAIRLLRAQRRR